LQNLREEILGSAVRPGRRSDMSFHQVLRPAALFLATGAVAALLAAPAAGRQGDLLLIGTSGQLSIKTDKTKEQGHLATLRALIKDETGMENKIIQQKGWRELADKLVRAKLAVGVFPGEEYAWAEKKFPALKPLALAANVYRYPTVYVVVRKADRATDFAALAGQPLALAASGQSYLRFFAESKARAAGKKLETFFSKVTYPENPEDALDDVVDGVVKATAVDRAALEAYKRRKPGRFKQLKEVAHSKPLPPPVIAYSSKSLDEAKRKRFLRGLLDAGKHERGKMMLNTFHLTGFETIPDDFEKVLTAARKEYPEPGAGKE
jgi:ABC-type phosphate/phosphonate transport system substrate-binding protein